MTRRRQDRHGRFLVCERCDGDMPASDCPVCDDCWAEFERYEAASVRWLAPDEGDSKRMKVLEGSKSASR